MSIFCALLGAVGGVLLMLAAGAVGQSVAQAADGSGTATVTPTTVVTGSTGNEETFTYTEAETGVRNCNTGGLCDGSLSITAPVGWSAPQGTPGTAGYTTASASSGGMIGKVENNLDSNAGWGSSLVTITTTSDPVTKYEGAASLAVTNTVAVGGLANAYYNYATPQNWSGFTRATFWFRTNTALIKSGDLKFRISESADLASHTESYNLPALTDNVWTYLTFNLAAGTGGRNAVRSWGIADVPTTLLATYQVDNFSLGPSVPTFSGQTVRVNLLSLPNAGTVTIVYGVGGGPSGATAQPTAGTATFTTQERSDSGGTLTSLGSSPQVTVVGSGTSSLRITGGATQTAGTTNELTIRAYTAAGSVDLTYVGTKLLTFSGLETAPTGNVPTVEGVNQGTAVSVAFTLGVSNVNAATLLAYKAETASLDVTDGALNSFDDSSYDLDLTVTPAATNATQTSISASPAPAPEDSPVTLSVQAKDQYGNSRTVGGDVVTLTVVGSNPAVPAVTDNGNGSYSASYTPTTPGTDNTTGTINLAAIGSDTDGTSNGTFVLTVTDATAPSTPGIPTTTTPTTDTTPTWSWTASTDDVGVTGYDICWDIFSGGCSNNTTVMINSFTHSVILADGTWYLKVRAVDASGNGSVYSAVGSVLIDTTTPTVPGTPTTTTPTTDTTPTFSWMASSDGGVGLDHYEVQWSQNSTFSSGVTTDSSEVPNSCALSLTVCGGAVGLADGTWYIRVRAVDALGNMSAYSSNGSVVVDTTGPSVPGVPTPDATPTSDATPRFTWTASTDTGSGLSHYQAQWSPDITFTAGVTTDLNEPDADCSISTGSCAGSGDLAPGAWYVRVRAVDNLGNLSGYSGTGLVVIAVGPGVPGTPATTTPTNDTTPTWTWTGSSGAVDHYEIYWDTVAGGMTNAATTLTNSFTHTVPLAEGTWFAKVRAVNGLGVLSGFSGDGSVVVDTAPPTSPSVTIDGGAGTTFSRLVTLTLSVVGATEMRISNSPDFAGAVWEAFATTKAWMLDDHHSIHTVYAQFRDAAGNESAAVSDSIDFLESAVGSGLRAAGGKLPTLPKAGTGLLAYLVTVVTGWLGYLVFIRRIRPSH